MNAWTRSLPALCAGRFGEIPISAIEECCMDVAGKTAPALQQAARSVDYATLRRSPFPCTRTFDEFTEHGQVVIDT